MTPDQLVEQTIARYEKYLNPGLASLVRFMGFESVEVEAEGCLVRDAHGNEYLDCLGGFGVFSFGHRHPKIVAAVREQLDRQPLSSRLLFSEQQGRLAELIAQHAPGDLQFSFFTNSGTESIEGALKLARLATGKTGFIAFDNAFHGKSLGSLSAGGREIYRQKFAPLVPGFTHVPFGDADAVAAAIGEDTAAVVVEPIQGEAGVIVPPADFLPRVQELCRANGVLLIADEVQTGMGRTGRTWAVDHYGVEPDIMTLAKALGGGVMPVGAIVGTARVFEPLVENPLLHSSTFGGNPLACAAGCAAFGVLHEENLAARAAEQGEKLLAALREVAEDHSEWILAVRGKGLMIGVEFRHEDVGGLVIAGMAQRHVIAAYTLNNPSVIRFEPPLTISDAQIQRAAAAFRESMEQTAELLQGVDLEE
ncbi:MAG: putrescine aminotransferase [Armatimonadetes bacterium CG_4_9_14_3_um_filter_66_14]|nr:MAG: putrescine aminotransferase [Armatimonadetes bacterium CG_4_9_14_3_um_filter_66_14]